MNWNTLFIKGKAGFERVVAENLAKAPISVMPGSFFELENIALYWVDENVTLRELKKAITSTVIFKYRLSFYNNLEAAMADGKVIQEDLSKQEEDLIHKMIISETERIRYRNSA